MALPLVFVVVLFVLGAVLSRQVSEVSPRSGRRAARWGSAVFVVALFALLAATGRLWVIPALIGGLLAWGGRLARAFYLFRAFQGDRGKGGAADSGSTSEMSRAEAAHLLGVSADASPEDVQAAYRKLIQKVHPDHGGSAGLAQRLTTARDRLLNT